MSTDVATTNGGLAGLKTALLPQSFEQVLRFAELVKDTEFVPKDFRGKAGHIVAAVTYGAELGLSPMQALNSMAVINGRPSLFGDGLLAVCMGHPDWEGIEETIAGTGEGRNARCVVKRKGRAQVGRDFSMADAKRAALSGKQGPWSQYPDRMLQMRARGFALRDQFADALRGMLSSVEAEDIPRDVTPPEQQRTNAETRRAAMREVEAVEVVNVYGEPCLIFPIEMAAWVANQVAEPVDDDALKTWADANATTNSAEAVDHAYEAEMGRRAAKAPKPNGASPELKQLYREAKAALERDDFQAAVQCKVRAFELTEDVKTRAGFDALFSTDEQQRELVA